MGLNNWSEREPAVDPIPVRPLLVSPQGASYQPFPSYQGSAAQAQAQGQTNFSGFSFADDVSHPFSPNRTNAGSWILIYNAIISRFELSHLFTENCCCTHDTRVQRHSMPPGVLCFCNSALDILSRHRISVPERLCAWMLILLIVRVLCFNKWAEEKVILWYEYCRAQQIGIRRACGARRSRCSARHIGNAALQVMTSLVNTHTPLQVWLCTS